MADDDYDLTPIFLGHGYASMTQFCYATKKEKRQIKRRRRIGFVNLSKLARRLRKRDKRRIKHGL